MDACSLYKIKDNIILIDGKFFVREGKDFFLLLCKGNLIES